MKIRFAVVAAATAFATLPSWGQGFQVGAATNVTISGFLGVGVKSASIGDSTRPGLSTEKRVDDNTSRLYISGNTKITDGWSAVWFIGSRFTADVRPGDQVLTGNTLTVSQASGWADDDTYAGISSPYGTLTFGKSSFYWSDTISLGHLSPALDAPGESYRIWDANGLGTFNILDQAPSIAKGGLLLNNYTLGITRSRNVIRWNSVNYSGFDASLAWTKNAVGGELWYPGLTPGVIGTAATTYGKNYEDGGTTYARVLYNGNGISLLASYLDQKIQGGVYNANFYTGALNTKAYRLGASYKLPLGLKVGVVFDSTEIENGVSAAAYGASLGSAKRTAFEVPISYAWGDHMAHVTYGKSGNVSSASDTGANQLNLVYDYALTKRAFIGLYYTHLKNDKNGHYAPFLTGYSFGATNPNPAGTNGESWTQIGLNLQYWF